MNGPQFKAKIVYFINRLDGVGLEMHVVEAVVRLMQRVQTPTRQGVEPVVADLGHPAQRNAAWERSFFCFCCPTATLSDAWETPALQWNHSSGSSHHVKLPQLILQFILTTS